MMTPRRLIPALAVAAAPLLVAAGPAPQPSELACHHHHCGQHRERDRDHHGDRHEHEGDQRNGEQGRERDRCHALLTFCGNSFDDILVEVGRALGPGH